jgi:hypothetical protein
MAERVKNESLSVYDNKELRKAAARNEAGETWRIRSFITCTFDLLLRSGSNGCSVGGGGGGGFKNKKKFWG